MSFDEMPDDVKREAYAEARDEHHRQVVEPRVHDLMRKAYKAELSGDSDTVFECTLSLESLREEA